MNSKTTPEKRRHFYLCHQQGTTYAMIAEEEGVSLECVRYWCRKQRAGKSCESQYYRKPEKKLGSFSDIVRYGILHLRLEHPRWGPERIRIHLRKRASLKKENLPSVASIGRYLHQWERFRRKAKKAAQTRPVPPSRVHQRWQMDFKINLKLRDGQLVDLHTVRDPVGEVCIGAYLVPTVKVVSRTERVSLESARTTLRACFEAWQTLPEEVQTDNESTLVTSRTDGFPSLFTLWLQGLGIQHRSIRPGKPTDNAEVERCHRTVYDYAIVGQEHLSLPQLQAHLAACVQELNFELPSRAKACHGKPPAQAHPELFQLRWYFLPELELAHFDLARVDAFLSTFTWRRKVGKNGQIGLGGSHQYYLVGRAFARREVLVRFDPSDRSFVFFLPDQPQKEISRAPAQWLDPEHITGIQPWPANFPPQQMLLPLFQKVIWS